MRKSKNQGEKNSSFGSKWIFNETLKISKKVKVSLEEMEILLTKGWKSGRKMKF